MREAIISSQFAEGEPVRQDDMARLFNVGKIPVCEHADLVALLEQPA